jgi:mono/diheme cytochrome c family protein
MTSDSTTGPKPCVTLTRRFLTLVLVLGILVVIWLVWPFVSHRLRGPAHYANIDQHFRYGSIGGENSDGIPYWVLRALPALFPDKMPGPDLTSFGFIQEPGQELPIGFSRSAQSFGIEVVTQNCAVCHVGTLRRRREDPNPQIISTMPGHTVNLQAFIQFLAATAVDERFNADNMMPFINAMGSKLNPLEKLVYRFIVIPRTRDEFIRQGHDFEFMARQSRYGPGRVDTFTSYKTRRYGFPVEQLEQSELQGISDFPSIWNQRPRQTLRLHWDGNNNDGSERNRTAALALVSPTTINFDSMERVRNWLMDLPAPRYPFAIDADLAAQGEPIFTQSCASCHSLGGDQLGKVTPIDQVKTDRGRLDSYTYALASNQNLTFSGIRYRGKDQRFSHFRKTNGYANTLLDGIWLRSPYLHNGSVPTLRDLLNPPDQRPEVFYRGNDVYDPVNVGFITNQAEENGKSYFRYDTRLPGNSPAGHLYGTDLSPAQKDALLEYLKTL